MVEVSRRKLLALGPVGVLGLTLAGYAGLGAGRFGARERARTRREQADRALAALQDAIADKRWDATSEPLRRAKRLYDRTETLATRVGCGRLAEYAAVRQRQLEYLESFVASASLAADMRQWEDSDEYRDKIRKNEREARKARQKARDVAAELPASTDCG